MSSFTQFKNLFFGLPVLLYPSTFILNAFLVMTFFPSNNMANHANLLNFSVTVYFQTSSDPLLFPFLLLNTSISTFASLSCGSFFYPSLSWTNTQIYTSRVHCRMVIYRGRFYALNRRFLQKVDDES